VVIVTCFAESPNREPIQTSSYQQGGMERLDWLPK
jgi:hypothetical protein